MEQLRSNSLNENVKILIETSKSVKKNFKTKTFSETINFLVIYNGIIN